MNESNTRTGIGDITATLWRVVRYNFKIVFAGKFIYFLGGAVAVFILVNIMSLLDPNAHPNESMVYWLLLVPGILIVFYPTTFGIQSDVDNRMIEILFGIPDYRYKVWLVRLVLIFIVLAMLLLALGALTSVVLVDVPIVGMTLQLLAPVIFLGCLSFMISTFVKNGSGTAVISVIIGLAFWLSRDFFEDHRTWDVFLNPYAIPDTMNAAVWQGIVIANRAYLAFGVVLSLLTGLFNLQHREKFLQ